MIFRIVAKVLYIFLVGIETVIALRFVFKLIGANGSNFIVSTIYSVSDVFIEPFVGIVSGDWSLGRFYVDVPALVALVIYMIIAFVLIEIIKVFSSSVTEE